MSTAKAPLSSEEMEAAIEHFMQNEEAVMGLGIALLGIFTAFFILYIFRSIALMTVFKKAGSAGWKAWIPFLSLYEQYRITWHEQWFWAYFGLSLLSGISTAGNIGKITGIMVSATLLLIRLFGYIKMAMSFGKSKGYGVGMYFFPGIFMLMLGLGSAQYRGNAEPINIFGYDI